MLAGIIPRPRSMGSFIILLTILAFIAGWIRNELTLALLGTLFLITLAYCFFGIFFLGLVHRRRSRSLSMAIVNVTVPVGGEGELSVTNSLSPAKNRFWRLPAILVRCELRLETRDGRVIRHFINPGLDNYSRFPVKERGAYYGDCDYFVIFDAPGFFRLSLPVQQTVQADSLNSRTSASDTSARLLAVPHQAEEAIPLSLKSGGSEERNEPHYRKSSELIDHRPYIPGDDPRRINWKLYGHTPWGELFVREGESEPPPRSRLLILIDTETDSTLYTPDESRRAVDMLCENALAAATEFSSRGMDILIGYTGGKIEGGNTEGAPMNAAQHAVALALPAAIFPGKNTFGEKPQGAEQPKAQLPQSPNDRAVLILALPRQFVSDTSALDRFLRKREANQGTDIVFLYSSESKQAAILEKAAALCANHYSARSGVQAVKAALPVGGTK